MTEIHQESEAFNRGYVHLTTTLRISTFFFRSVNFNTKNLKPLFNVLLSRENSRTPTLTTVYKLL